MYPTSHPSRSATKQGEGTFQRAEPTNESALDHSLHPRCGGGLTAACRPAAHRYASLCNGVRFGRSRFGDALMEMDDAVGQIMAALKRSGAGGTCEYSTSTLSTWRHGTVQNRRSRSLRETVHCSILRHVAQCVWGRSRVRYVGPHIVLQHVVLCCRRDDHYILHVGQRAVADHAVVGRQLWLVPRRQDDDVGGWSA